MDVGDGTQTLFGDGDGAQPLFGNGIDLQNLFGDGVDASLEDDDFDRVSLGNGIDALLDSADMQHNGVQNHYDQQYDFGTADLNLPLDELGDLAVAQPDQRLERSQTPSDHITVNGNGQSVHEQSSSPVPMHPRYMPEYEFRPREKLVPKTWIDLDNSGDYDPAEEARKLKAQNKRSRSSKKSGKPRATKKQKKPKKIIILKLVSTDAFEILNDNIDNWPDNWSYVSEDVASETGFDRLRRHPEHVPVPDPKGELDDLTGLPIARGCVNCRKYSQQCTLVDGGTYPCAYCIEDAVEGGCELLMPPKVKATCHRCEEMGLVCSFTTGGSHEGMCEQCQEASLQKCAAGPGPGTKLRMEEHIQQIRKHAACNTCRQLGKRCSLKRKRDKAPCGSCRKAGIACTFLDPVVKKPKHLGTSGSRAVTSSQENNGEGSSSAALNSEPLRKTMRDFGFSDNEEEKEEVQQEQAQRSTPSVAMTDLYGNIGMTTDIMTCFSHPMKFSLGLDGEEVVLCNFCNNPCFGLTGYGERKILTIKWSNGLGYTELYEGHYRENGPTEMCADCATARIQIIECQCHRMRRYENADQILEAGQDEALDALTEVLPHTEAAKRGIERFCSLCFDVATHECCTTAEAMISENDEQVDGRCAGCGFRLCETCATQFFEKFDNIATDIVEACDARQKYKYEDGQQIEEQVFRADVGLLHKEGLLYRNFLAVLANMEGLDDVEGMDLDDMEI